MERTLTHELMDDPNVPPDQLALSLRYIRAVNRNLGGTRALLRHLKNWSRRWPTDRPVTLLDVGTGSADIPVAAHQWAVRAGYDLRVTAIDKHVATLGFARDYIHGNRSIQLLEADALTLDAQFQPASFDYVHAGMFLHHLSDTDIVTVLGHMGALASKGVVWNDLVRSQASHRVVRLLTIGKPEIIKHDARVSILAGFTRQEALDLAARAGLDYTNYSWSLWAHRFTIAGEKPDAWGS